MQTLRQVLLLLSERSPKPIWTFGIQLCGFAAGYNIEILKRLEMKVSGLIKGTQIPANYDRTEVSHDPQDARPDGNRNPPAGKERAADRSRTMLRKGRCRIVFQTAERRRPSLPGPVHLRLGVCVAGRDRAVRGRKNNTRQFWNLPSEECFTRKFCAALDEVLQKSKLWNSYILSRYVAGCNKFPNTVPGPFLIRNIIRLLNNLPADIRVGQRSTRGIFAMKPSAVQEFAGAAGIPDRVDRSRPPPGNERRGSFRNSKKVPWGDRGK